MLSLQCGLPQMNPSSYVRRWMEYNGVYIFLSPLHLFLFVFSEKVLFIYLLNGIDALDVYR
jgi:hypothetical protein